MLFAVTLMLLRVPKSSSQQQGDGCERETGFLREMATAAPSRVGRFQKVEGMDARGKLLLPRVPESGVRGLAEAAGTDVGGKILPVVTLMLSHVPKSSLEQRAEGCEGEKGFVATLLLPRSQKAKRRLGGKGFSLRNCSCVCSRV
jgi:hypothetical protein